jgi:hypothetical protein
MSGYCEIADVKREMGRYGPNLTATSVPNLTQAGEIIDDIAAEIDGVLAARSVQVPVAVPPNPVSLTSWVEGFLKRLNALGTAGVVLQGMFPHAAGPASSNLGDDKTREYRSLLKQLTDGENLIPDNIIIVTGGVAPGEPRSLWTDGNVDSEAVALGTTGDPIFTRTTEW